MLDEKTKEKSKSHQKLFFFCIVDKNKQIGVFVMASSVYSINFTTSALHGTHQRRSVCFMTACLYKPSV